MTKSVFVAEPSDMSAIAAIMDKGFHSDPTVIWASSTEKDFLSLHHKFVEVCARPAFERGCVHALSDFAGAAIWYPPGVGIDESELATVFKTASRPERIEEFFQLLEACEQYRPAEPYWELELISIDPMLQGQGFGATLLEHGLAICDGEGAPVYLESSNPANLSFYRRHGFELLAEVQLPGSPKRFPMLRK